MSSFAYCLLGLLCLSAVSAHSLRVDRPDNGERDVKIIIKTRLDRDKELDSHRSCGLNQGTVCIPTACSNNSCSLFKDAVCVADRCGCEARFFNWMKKEQAFQDVSKMCFSTNAIANFINFTALANDTGAALLKNDDKPIIAFFKEFNVLVTEILKDIADYIGVVTKASPTQENIDKLKSVLRTLDSLKGARSRSSTIRSKEEADEIEKRIDWGKVLSTGLKIVKNVLLDEDVSVIDPVQNVSDEDTDLEGRISIGKIFKTGLNIAKKVLFDEDIDASKNGTLKLSKTGEQFIADAMVLEDVLSKDGRFADAVKSGNVAISDKDAQRVLKGLIF